MLNLGFHSGKNVPPIYVRPAVADRILEVIAALILILNWVLILFAWGNDGSGKITGFEPFLPVVMGTFLLLLLGWSGYVPIRLINFPVRVHEGNAVIQYVYATRVARVINIIVQLVFFISTLFYRPVGDYYEVSIQVLESCFAGVLIVIPFVLLVYWLIAFRYK